MTRSVHLRAAVLAVAILVGSCSRGEEPGDELVLPELLTTPLPFAYPADLYQARIEGDVGLQLYVDSSGLVVPDSTRVVEPSTHAAFDSAALAGAIYLSFRPAERGGRRVGRTIVLPVQFRVPRDSAAADTAVPK
jgi:TonB family protein